MTNVDLDFSKRRIFIFSDVCMTLRSFVNCTRRVDPKNFFGSSVNSMQIPAKYEN